MIGTLRHCDPAGGRSRKTDTSKSIGRGVDNVHFVKKLVKKAFHHAVYYTLVGARNRAAKSRRASSQGRL